MNSPVNATDKSKMNSHGVQTQMTPEKKAILEEICRRDIPSYVIDLASLKRNLETFAYIKSASGCKFFLALKSFCTFPVFPLIATVFDGASASSLNEVRLGNEYFKKEMHTYSPGFEDHNIDEICQLSSHIIFNSVSQYDRFLPVAKHHSCQTGLRLNVEKSVSPYPPYDPSRPYSRFGITQKELNQHQISSPPDGYLVHNSPCSSKMGLDDTIAALESKFSDQLRAASWLNLGGSHYITNTDYDVDHLISKIKYLSAKYDLEIYLEPGYAVTANAGYLCARVVDVFTNEKQIGILNVSPNNHFISTLEGGFMHDIVGAAPLGSTPYTYLLGANTCLSSDVLGEYSFPQPLHPGDPIILEDMVAYTMVRSSWFNGINLPSLGLLDENNVFTLLSESDYSDFKQTMSKASQVLAQ